MSVLYGDFDPEFDRPEPISAPLGYEKRLQNILDLITPYVVLRWIFTFITFSLFVYRSIHYQKWFLIFYLISVDMIASIIKFFSPLVYPNFDELSGENGPTLPTSSSDEFKPFVRQMSEFKLWQSISINATVSLILSMFDFFDISVSWIFLLLYFIIYTIASFWDVISNMRKYNYLPWNIGKPRYNSS